ncbi:unnamed protein product [Acanthosepion pharaonis]|uniref:Uncharacterized protein n=1 Tax=Acanthosepion pharaonis TaxID=158019 RepID=A0A812BP36_ACAPH|nr:unnamed protein product [Sepia pharaonis]
MCRHSFSLHFYNLHHSILFFALFLLLSFAPPHSLSHSFSASLSLSLTLCFSASLFLSLSLSQRSFLSFSSNVTPSCLQKATASINEASENSSCGRCTACVVQRCSKSTMINQGSTEKRNKNGIRSCTINRLSIYLSISLSIYLSMSVHSYLAIVMYVYLYLSFGRYIYLSIYLSIYPIYPIFFMSVSLFISICQSIYLIF